MKCSNWQGALQLPDTLRQNKPHSNDDCGAHGYLPSLAPDRRDGYRNITLSVSGRSTNEYYSTILFLGSDGAGKSVSPSISRKSISAIRHICEIGTSFALPSNGFSVLSPTRTSEVYIQEINTLKGMTSQTMLPLITPSTLSLSLSNSLSKPKGSRRQNNLMKKALTVAYCLGYGKSLMRSHLLCCKRKSLIDLCMSRNCATPIAWLAKSPFIVLL